MLPDIIHNPGLVLLVRHLFFDKLSIFRLSVAAEGIHYARRLDLETNPLPESLPQNLPAYLLTILLPKMPVTAELIIKRIVNNPCLNRI